MVGSDGPLMGKWLGEFLVRCLRSFIGPAHLKCVKLKFEPRHEISNNVVCATSKGSDQPAHTHSLIRAFASRMVIHWILSY